MMLANAGDPEMPSSIKSGSSKDANYSKDTIAQATDLKRHNIINDDPSLP